jgi:hypothetical protein
MSQMNSRPQKRSIIALTAIVASGVVMSGVPNVLSGRSVGAERKDDLVCRLCRDQVDRPQSHGVLGLQLCRL